MNAEEKSIETLGKIKKIFDKHNIEYWLDEGTLLGAVREKKGQKEEILNLKLFMTIKL